MCKDRATGQNVLVPRTPTASMIKAAWADALAEDAEGVWRSMIEAYENEISRRGEGIQRSEDCPGDEVRGSGS
jgi:hypothetical protein